MRATRFIARWRCITRARRWQTLGDDFPAIAARVLEEPGAVLDALATRRLLPEIDAEAEDILATALDAMEKPLRRRVLLTYLGFPFYDVATLPLLRNEGLTEFNAVKVDRISPEDATTIRARRHIGHFARHRVFQLRRLFLTRLPRE